jgi:kumamolisin
MSTSARSLLLCFLALPGTAHPEPAPAPAREVESAAVRLGGHVLPALARASRVAPANGAGGASSAPLSLTVVLRRDDEAGFQRFVGSVSDPRSPDFRRTLSPAAQSDRFGPSRATYEHVLGFLEKSGFTLAEGSSNRLTLRVLGTCAQAERAFGISIRDYELAGRRFFANDRDPELPADVAAHVLAVGGLNSLAAPKPQQWVLTELVIAWDLFTFNPYQVLQLLKGLGAADENLYNATAEKLPHLTSAQSSGTAPLAAPQTATWMGGDGTGQTIGLVEFDTYATSDVSDYLALNGFAATSINRLSKVDVDGGATTGGFGPEVLVDVDTALTFAPGANVVVYAAPFSSFNFASVFNAMITGGVTVISNSWAYCEDQTNLADVQSIDSMLMTAAGAGISVFNAAGDTGAVCLDGSPGTIAVPADSPHATAVGGSSATFGPADVWVAEKWWNGGADSPPTGQGGYGVSKFFTRPSYQNGLTTAPGRSVPDVVLNADPAKGVTICQASGGGCPDGRLWGGTSFAAPAWAAFTAILNQVHGSNLGEMNPHLYPLANTPAFHSAAQLGSDFGHVGLGSPNVDPMHLALDGASAGAVDALTSELTASGVAVADGTTSAYVTARLRDSDGNTVSGKTVSLAPNGGSSALVAPVSGISNVENGAAVFSVTDTVVEDVVFTAHDDTDNVTLSPTVTLHFAGPPAAAGGIGTEPSTVPANGSSFSVLTVTLQDAHGNGTPGKVVTLSQGSGRSQVTGPSPLTTDTDGQVQFQVSDLYPEIVTYSALDVSDGSLPIPAQAQVTFVGGVSGTCPAGQEVPQAGWAVTSPETGFAIASNCVGASGTAWDPAGNLWVMNYPTGNLYKFASAGGTATAATLVGTLPNTSPPSGLPSCPHGLAFSKDGQHLYLARQFCGNAGDVVEISTADAHVIRNVAPASSIPCATGIATDPLSGDLFVTTPCQFGGTDNIYRVSSPESGSPGVSIYASPGHALGLNFTPDGTIWTQAYNFGSSTRHLYKIAGTTAQTPGALTDLLDVTASLPNANAVLPVLNPADPGHPPFLLVSASLDQPVMGQLAKVDLTQMPPVVSQVATGGTGLIFVNSGPDGCAYISNADRVDRVSAADGTCSFSPSFAGPSIGLSPSVVAPNPEQGSGHATFTASLHGVASPEGTPVFFVVGGADFGLVQLVRAGADGKASWTYSGRFQGTDRVTASATIDGTLVTSNVGTVTWTSGADTTVVNPSTSPKGAITQASTSFSANLFDVTGAAPIGGASVHFTIGAQSCDGVTNGLGFASCSFAPSAAGLFTLTASYAGDAGHLPSNASQGLRVLGAGLRGDANGSGGRDVADVFYLINALFAGGPQPATQCRGDADASGTIDIADVFYLINFLFAGGPPPPSC